MPVVRISQQANNDCLPCCIAKAGVAIHFAHYNFCRVHQTLRVTPAMAAGIANEIWSPDRLLSQVQTP